MFEHDSQLMTQFWKRVEHLGDRASLEDFSHWGVGLEAFQPSPLPVCSLFDGLSALKLHVEVGVLPPLHCFLSAKGKISVLAVGIPSANSV